MLIVLSLSINLSRKNQALLDGLIRSYAEVYSTEECGLRQIELNRRPKMDTHLLHHGSI